MSEVCLPLWAVLGLVTGESILAGLAGWQAEPPDVIQDTDQ